MNSLQEEICTALQEAILSTKIELPGLRKTAKSVEIKYVVLNRDFSHVDAFWESDMLTDFFQFSANKFRNNTDNSNSNSSNSNNSNSNSGSDSKVNNSQKGGSLTPDKLLIFEERIKKSINQALQNREPTFRTAIIKRLEFGRVPRVYFKPYDTMNSKLLRQQNRDAIVKRALDDHVREFGHMIEEEDDGGASSKV